jgi:tetratricopeptide (TPR) repeat protein
MKRGIGGLFFTTCFVVVLCLWQPLAAQNKKADSLKKALLNEAEDSNKVNTLNAMSECLWRIGSYDSSIVYSTKALALGEKTGFKKGEAAALRHRGLAFYYEGNFDKALENQLKALDINKEIGYKSGIASNYGNIGNIFDEQGNYPKALEYQFQALAMDKEVDNKYGVASCLANIGIIYYEEQSYTKALEYDFNALSIYNQIGNKLGIAIALANIGALYGTEGNNISALEYDNEALARYQEIDNVNGVANTYGNLGSIYLSQRNHVKALEYFFKSYVLKRQIGDQVGMAEGLCDIASADLKLGKIMEAEAYIDSAIVMATGIREEKDLRDAYLIKAQLDSVRNDYKSEVQDYKKYMIYHDSLENESNTRKMLQSQMNYDFNQKMAIQKAVQDKKDAIASADKARQQVVTDLITVGLVLVMIFSVLLFSRFRLTQKQKKVIEEQKLLVEEKNKAIVDSINYARRLQDAILPPLSQVKQFLPDSFLLYKPKDIVAGDFYWMERSGDNILIAAADSTGHGVPGAMTSVVCSNALNRALNEFKINDTGKLLDKTRELVLETFAKSEGEIKDGMDISICAINQKANRLEWSGANSPLWFLRNGEIKEIIPDKQPVGKYEAVTPFTTHTIELHKGDILYLFTDGYADQFGGPKEKKFMARQMKEILLTNADLPMEEQKALLDKALMTWQGSLEQVDDILVIGIRV